MTTQSNPPAWYSIRQRTPVAAAAQGVQSAAEIFIYGDIGESWFGDSITAANFVKDLGEVKADALSVRINSFGGSVTDGITIHNAIKRHPAAVTVSIDGLAASIASLIAMAGDTVEMAENAMLMIHAPWAGAVGNAADLRATADMLDDWAQAMSTSYAAKSGKPAADVLALLTDGKDHWYTAAEAQAEGFVNAVITASPESASAMASFNLSRYRTAPVNLGQGIPVAAATSIPPESSMTKNVENTQAAATQTAPLDHAAISAAALAADAQRRVDIAARFKPFSGREGVAALQAACEADHGTTAQAAADKLLAHLGAGGVPVQGRVEIVQDESDKRISAMSESIMARASVVTAAGRVVADGRNPYRGASLLDLARASLQAVGVRTEGMDKRAVVAAAFTQSTSDFPVLLENTLNKTLLSAYALQADTWTRFCARGTVSDFRAHKRYRVGSLSNLDGKTELGEFRSKAIPDGEQASITAGTKGNIINLSRETIINDDLGAFTGLAASLGRAAKRTVEADVFATLALNGGLGPLLSDGFAMFHASRNNAATGAPTVAAFEAARVLMAKQKDVSGNDFLALKPAVWLGPMELGGQARTVINSTYDPDAANKLQRANIAANLVGDIVDTPRLSGAPWYFFANANEAPVLEVAFLDGNDSPYLEMENGFSVDGVSWKVRLDYGIAGIDFRGAVRSTGV